MIHTNELSTMVSNEAFNEILDTFNFTYLKMDAGVTLD